MLVLLMTMLILNVSNMSIVGKVVEDVNSVNPIAKFTGYVVSESVDEVVVESFDKEIDLEIREAPEMFGEKVSENKNERMEFDKGLRLYFDLLNYSEYVRSVRQDESSESGVLLRK